MKSCIKGYQVSLSDRKRRCVKIVNRTFCNKMNKEYSSQTKKCRKSCKNNEDRINRKDKRGTRCRRNCGVNQERGLKYCRNKCKSNQRRVTRKDRRGTRCILRRR
jgi:hypothetical protein